MVVKMKRKCFGIMALSLALICSSVTATVTSAYEPDRAKASYATPAKANVDEKNMSHIGNYSYCLIRNKTAAKIYVNSGTEKTEKTDKATLRHHILSRRKKLVVWTVM